ncbi:MAG: ABC transporter permease [Planctomycetia bacterium]
MRPAFGEILHHLDLLLELSGRDIRIRYKQTALGAAWALFTPVLMMIIFTQVFGRLPRGDVGDVAYPVFVYCGLLPWQFFASSLKGAVESLTRNSRLVTKVYFPRAVFPLAAIVSSAVDFVIASSVLVVLMAWYGVSVGTAVFFLPAVVLVQLLLTVGLALILSMGNLFYRDVKYIFEVVLLVWMFLSSVVVPMPRDGWASWVAALNPMTTVIEAYRDVLLHDRLPAMGPFAAAAAVGLVLAAAAFHWFHEAEYLFAERV